MTIIRLHHRHPRCPINCTSVPLLILPLENLTVQGADGAAVALLLVNLIIVIKTSFKCQNGQAAAAACPFR